MAAAEKFEYAKCPDIDEDLVALLRSKEAEIESLTEHLNAATRELRRLSAHGAVKVTEKAKKRQRTTPSPGGNAT